MSFVQSELLEVKRIQGKGRGVFARRFIAEGTIIERVPVLVVPSDEIGDDELLARYCFHWGKQTLGFALGYGSLYNHSYRPNAEYRDLSPQTKEFIAIRDIPAGEEVTINYNGDIGDGTPIGFDVR